MLLLLAFIPNVSHAAASQWWLSDKNENVEVRLLLSKKAYEEKKIIGALEIKIHDNWFIPWRSNANPKYDTIMDWTDSQNIRVLTETWPMPLNIITDNKKANTAGYLKHFDFTFKA